MRQEVRDVGRAAGAGARRATGTRSPRWCDRTARAAGALLPDARLAAGRRGRAAGDAARGVAWAWRVRGALVGADLAVPDRHQPLPQPAALRPAAARPPTPLPVRAAGAVPARRGVVACSPIPTCCWTSCPTTIAGPEARYESREAISLAFVTALQLLPPNQRAVLLLRDVLGYRASEAADLLGLTEDAVTNALKRARATLDAARPRPPPPAPGGPDERALLDRFVAAFTERDVDALVALMTDDVWVRMPPLPFEYHGTAAAHRFFTAIELAPAPDRPDGAGAGEPASPRGASTSATRSPAACTSSACSWSPWPATGSARSPTSTRRRPLLRPPPDPRLTWPRARRPGCRAAPSQARVMSGSAPEARYLQTAADDGERVPMCSRSSGDRSRNGPSSSRTDRPCTADQAAGSAPGAARGRQGSGLDQLVERADSSAYGSASPVVPARRGRGVRRRRRPRTARLAERELDVRPADRLEPRPRPSPGRSRGPLEPRGHGLLELRPCPRTATSASSSSRSAKWRYAALCETPVRRATSRSTTPSGPLARASSAPASTRAARRLPWWYGCWRSGRGGHGPIIARC